MKNHFRSHGVCTETDCRHSPENPGAAHTDWWTFANHCHVIYKCRQTRCNKCEWVCSDERSSSILWLKSLIKPILLCCASFSSCTAATTSLFVKEVADIPPDWTEDMVIYHTYYRIITKNFQLAPIQDSSTYYRCYSTFQVCSGRLRKASRLPWVSST